MFIQPWPAIDKEKARWSAGHDGYYQYRADGARRTLRGINERSAKAEQAVAGKTSAKGLRQEVSGSR